MHIAISGRIFIHKKREGIAWYADRMIAAMAAARTQYTFTIIIPKGSHVSDDWPENVVMHEVGPHRFDPIALPWWLYVTLPKAINQLDPDLFWAPDGLMPMGAACPLVATIHDISPVIVPDTMRMRDRVYFKRYVKRILEQADHIFTVSETSKQEILRVYKQPADRLTVTYNSAREVFKPISKTDKLKVCQEYTGTKPFILHVGAIHPRKRVGEVVHAYEQYRASNPEDNLQLVLIGRKAWQYRAVFDRIANSPWKADIHWLGYLPDDELARIMGGSEMLVNFARHEGFGLSVVEALVSEVPVICAPISALPEIAGEAAIYAKSTEDLSDAIKSLRINDQLREMLIDKGREQQKKFRWNVSAHTGITVFESIFDKRI